MYGNYYPGNTGNMGNMGNINPYPNMYQSRLNAYQQQQQLPRYEIVHVNGENGARSFQMAANSECLLLDDTAPLVWLVRTDGAGYPTFKAYTISEYMPTQPTVNPDLLNRLEKLEAIIYGKQSDPGHAPAADRPADPPAAV